MEVLKTMSLHDLILARGLGISDEEVEEIDLTRRKNELHQKAFSMRDGKQKLTQDRANALNSELQEIIRKLEEYGYDIMCDYYVDFDSFVPGNKYYNKFAW